MTPTIAAGSGEAAVESGPETSFSSGTAPARPSRRRDRTAQSRPQCHGLRRGAPQSAARRARLRRRARRLRIAPSRKLLRPCWPSQSGRQIGGPACGARKVCKQRKIDLPAPRMEIGEALRQLGHLGNAAGDGDARHRMAAHIFEHSADEISHVDQCDLRQAVKFLNRGFRTAAGRTGDVREAGGARHIDAAMNGVDPRRARIGHDDARRAEDRQAADDAETAVQRLRRQFHAARNRNFHVGVGGAAGHRRDFRDGVTDHTARHRIDGGLSGRQRQTGPRDGADALAGAKRDACTRRADAHRRHDQRTMSHIGIVAGILDHARSRGGSVHPRHGEREAGMFAARQRHLDRIGKIAGQQRGERGFRRRGRACPGGPASTQRPFLSLHAFSFSPGHPDRHPMDIVT